MKIAISAEGKDLNSSVDPRFGRCSYIIIADSDSKGFEVYDNPGIQSTQGAGIQAAQFVAKKKAESLITGKVGPNALQILDSAGIKVYNGTGLTAAEVIDCFKDDMLSRVNEPGEAHAGLKYRHGRSQGW